MTAPSPPPRQINWALVIAFVGWGGFGLIAWGSLSTQVAGHDRRIDRIEGTYASDKDMLALATSLGTRLGRIEGQLDRLNENFRRPQP